MPELYAEWYKREGFTSEEEAAEWIFGSMSSGFLYRKLGNGVDAIIAEFCSQHEKANTNICDLLKKIDEEKE